jgi:hypothetical protein
MYFDEKEIDLCHALVDALRRDYVDFVELLMNYGTSLEKLTLNDLEQLYASAEVCLILNLHIYIPIMSPLFNY